MGVRPASEESIRDMFNRVSRQAEEGGGGHLVFYGSVMLAMKTNDAVPATFAGTTSYCLLVLYVCRRL